jgi:hypothetical protein
MAADGAATARCTFAAVATCCVSAAVADCCGSVVVVACCGPAATTALCGAPLAAAALSAACDALDERRLVGTAVSDLSTLAGTRGARWTPPCERKKEKVKLSLI